jgi:hypothetical protein
MAMVQELEYMARSLAITLDLADGRSCTGNLQRFGNVVPVDEPGRVLHGLLCAFGAGAAGAAITSGFGVEIGLLYLRVQALNETKATM